MNKTLCGAGPARPWALARVLLTTTVATGCGLGAMRTSDRAAMPAAPMVPVLVENSAPDVPAAGGRLDLAKAVSLALGGNPELHALGWRYRAAEAEIAQARLRPNPQMTLTLEDAAGSGRYRGVRQAEETLRLSQVAELGGKRAARVQRAALAGDLAAWDYEAVRLDVLERVVRTFVDVVSADERVRLFEETARVARDVLATAEMRVAAASASPAEVARARAALAGVDVELMQAHRTVEAARARLAATWGDVAPTFTGVDGALHALRPLPALPALQDRLTNNPDLERWATEVAERRATQVLEERQAVPNVTVSLGGRRFETTGDGAMVVELSLPLPLWNRNQGAVAAARARVGEAEATQRQTRVQLVALLAEAYRSLASAHAQATALAGVVVPASRDAYRVVAAGYREGRFGYLEVLDAQRALMLARTQEVDALASYHRAVASVERLVGGPLDGEQREERR